MHLDMFRVVRLEGSIVRSVKMDENRHHLTRAELTCTLSLFACCEATSFPLRLKVEPKIIEPHKTIRVHSLLDPSGGE